MKLQCSTGGKLHLKGGQKNAVKVVLILTFYVNLKETRGAGKNKRDHPEEIKPGAVRNGKGRRVGRNPEGVGPGRGGATRRTNQGYCRYRGRAYMGVGWAREGGQEGQEALDHSVT